MKLDTGGRLEMRPDLVFVRDGKTVLVADTKYKELKVGKPAVADVYQMLAYCRAAQLLCVVRFD